MAKKTHVDIDWTFVHRQLSPDLRAELDDWILDEPVQVKDVSIYTDGSFACTVDEKKAGWAFLAIGRWEEESYVLGYDWGIVDIDPLEEGWTGAERADSKAAEATAVLRALEWAFSHNLKTTYTFYFDSQLAGSSSSGVFGVAPWDRQHRALRAMAKAFEAFHRPHGMTFWQHVKAHNGTLGNEIVDIFAKRAFSEQSSLHSWTCPDYSPFLFGKRFPLEYFWMMWDATSGLSNGGDRRSVPLLRDHLPDVPGCLEEKLPLELLSVPETQESMKHLRFFAATYNVATLGKGTGGFVHYLRQQAESHGLDLLFLQETRSKRSQMVLSGSHVRVIAEAINGVGGLELWFARSHSHKQHRIFDHDKIRVLHANSQMLFVKATYQTVDLLLVNLHAPHSGRPSQEVEEYWAEVTSLLTSFCSRYPHVIFGGDANAHFDAECEGCIGEAGLESKENLGGRLFRELLIRFGLFLPSTFADIHRGKHATWFHSAHDTMSRCDYFALPQAWRQAKIGTWVFDTLDIVKDGMDHLPLALTFRMAFQVQANVKKTAGFCRRSLQKATLEQLQATLKNVSIPEWQCDVDRHAMSLSQQIFQGLCDAFPVTPQGIKKSYISQEAWHIRRARIFCRKLTRELLLRSHKLTVWSAWGHLAGRACFDTRALLLQGFDVISRFQKARGFSAALTKSLRKCLRRDRAASLASLAGQITTMTAREFANALRAIGVVNPKKPTGIKPLPILHDEHGRPAETEEAVAALWRGYFGSQEDGVVTTFEQLFSSRKHGLEASIVMPDWSEIPSIYQVESQFRKTALGKAYFADNIPGDLLRKAPVRMAELFYSLYCKEVVRLQEPLLYKGGYLVAARKKGNPCLVTNYRSLFVSSVIAKALHSIYRADLAESFAAHRLGLQVGGLPGQGIVQPVHSLHLFQQEAIASGNSYAILFVDISNAFYKVVRQHVVTPADDDRGARELFGSLGLPPQAFCEFQELLRQPDALDAAEVPPHLKALFREFFTSTWFMIRGDQAVTHTRKGSRPGDAFADLVFSFALTKFVQRALNQLQMEFNDLGIWWNGEKTIYPEGDFQVDLGPLTPVWADDLAFAVSDGAPEMLIHKITRVTAVLFENLLAAGLTPNLKKGKSEILIDLRGPGSLALRRDLLRQENVLRIDSRYGPFELHLVGAYKHLGTWLQVGAGIQKGH